MNGVVLIGPPGCGKSTIGRMIATALNMVYVSSGDIARKMAQTDERAKSALAQGKMAPESSMRNEVYRTLYDINYSRREFVLDGFPRFNDQMKWLAVRFPSLIIVNVDVPDNVCVARMLGRERDGEDLGIIMKRMQYYNKHTKPMLDTIPCNYITVSNHNTPQGYAAIDAIREIYRRMHDAEHS